MLTPIFIDYTQKEPAYQTSNYLELHTKDPVDLYTEDLNTISNTKERILAPRYYVLIYPPANNFQATKKIDIQKAPHSLGANTLRVSLAPSEGYGINACYRIEYWKWYPMLNSTAEITKTLVHTEHWFVPTITTTGLYLPNRYYTELPRVWPHSIAQWNIATHYMYYWPCYYNRLAVSEYIADRFVEGDYVYDTLTTKDALAIGSLFGKEDTITVFEQPDKFRYNKEVKDWTFSKDIYKVRLKRLISGVNGLEHAEPVTEQKVKIKVKHYLPIHPYDMIVKEDYLV